MYFRTVNDDTCEEEGRRGKGEGGMRKEDRRRRKEEGGQVLEKEERNKK